MKRAERSTLPSWKSESSRPSVAIQGLPVFSKALLRGGHPVFEEIKPTEDYVRFARQLRGQFSIVVDSGSDTVAITDFCGSRPIFYAWDKHKQAYRVSHFQPRTLARDGMSKQALFFYATQGGLGIDPFFSGILQVPPATVMRFSGRKVASISYLDWGELLHTAPVRPRDAEEQFIQIAREYLGAVLSSHTKVGVLLSGGTDSSLVSLLLGSMGKEIVAFTADYHWNRYSEYSDAASHANRLRIPQKRVLITGKTHRNAFRTLNSNEQNGPSCHSQCPSLYELAQQAKAHGISTLATGDHADALFLGFESQFSGLPRHFPDYIEAIAKLDVREKLARLYQKPSLRCEESEIISCLGYDPKECSEWQEQLYVQDTHRMEQWARGTPLPVLQQLRGQLWAGIPWQNIFLPVTQAVQYQVEFISPFYDLDMVKFALSLPVECKFYNGTTKAILRDVLYRLTGIRVEKRASPNPSRLWNLYPHFQERRRQIPALKVLYDRVLLRNIHKRGRLYSHLDRIASLGIWLNETGVWN